MLSTILRKRAQALAVILVLSVFLVATTVFAATKLIEAKKGGVVQIAQGVELVIRPNALEEDTVIAASMELQRKRVVFEFGPDGTKFRKPAHLSLSWAAMEALGDLESLTLYGEDGEEIEPKIKGWGMEYPIDHFSLYYHRRR